MQGFTKKKPKCVYLLCQAGVDVGAGWKVWLCRTTVVSCLGCDQRQRIILSPSCRAFPPRHQLCPARPALAQHISQHSSKKGESVDLRSFCHLRNFLEALFDCFEWITRANTCNVATADRQSAFRRKNASQSHPQPGMLPTFKRHSWMISKFPISPAGQHGALP